MRAILASLFLLATLAPAQSTARMEGRVVDPAGAPIRKATIRLYVGYLPKLSTWVEVSDTNGNFTFRDLPAGQFRISVTHPGFTRTEDLPNMTLLAGEVRTDFRIKMNPLGIVSGSVTDEDGDPVSGAVVNVVQVRLGGPSSERNAGTARTDDLGDFRVPGIEPGRYYLKANASSMPQDEQVGLFSEHIDAPVGRSAQDVNVTTYYPSSTALDDARQVEIKFGIQLSGLRIQMRRVRTYSVRGRIVMPAGEPLIGAVLALLSRQDGT